MHHQFFRIYWAQLTGNFTIFWKIHSIQFTQGPQGQQTSMGKSRIQITRKMALKMSDTISTGIRTIHRTILKMKLHMLSISNMFICSKRCLSLSLLALFHSFVSFWKQLYIQCHKMRRCENPGEMICKCLGLSYCGRVEQSNRLIYTNL